MNLTDDFFEVDIITIITISAKLCSTFARCHVSVSVSKDSFILYHLIACFEYQGDKSFWQ